MGRAKRNNPFFLLFLVWLLGTTAYSQNNDQYKLAIFYVIPSDIAYEEKVYQRLTATARDVQAWYQSATGGLTWKLTAPEVVKVYQAQNPRSYYQGNDGWNWWGELLSEMSANGLPVWSPGTVTAIWARGAGWWAGGAQGCEGRCGAVVVGIEVFPEFNRVEWSGRECPGGVGGPAWPCVPEGALAHELGHTLGLPHPFDFPETAAVSAHSIMHTHWNYPRFAPPAESPWGFLSVERQKLLSNPFMHSGIKLVQTHDCDIVNLPETGATPDAAFDFVTSGLDLTTINVSSKDSTLHYWTFDDGAVSNEPGPSHSFSKPSTYTVALRVSNDLGMMSLAKRQVAVSAPGYSLVFPQFANGEAGGRKNRTRLVLRLNSKETVSGSLRFGDGNGNQARVPVNGQMVDNIGFSLSPFSTVDVQTDGTGPLTSGVVEVVADTGDGSKVEGTLIFEILGSFVSVPATPVRANHQVYVSFSSEENTGTALFNPDPSSPATLRLVLVDSRGKVQANRTVVLQPREQLVAFVNEGFFFQDFFAGKAQFRGTLNISVTQGSAIAAIGLLQKRNGSLIAVATSENVFVP